MINYKEESMMFDDFLKINNYTKKEIFPNDLNICNDLSKISVLNPINLDFNFKNINKLFIESIDILDNKTIEYYKNVLSNIKIHRNMFYENGYAEVIGNNKKQEIYVTRKKFKDIDFVAFSHELGHIPALKTGARLDYFEYSEILPIFFEYLSWLIIDKENTYDKFISSRLYIAKEEAKQFVEKDNIRFYDDRYHYMYLDYLKRDNLKYIISLEYALYLIDIYKEDKEMIRHIVSSILFDYSSFKNIENELNLNIKEYNKLKSLIK